MSAVNRILGEADGSRQPQRPLPQEITMELIATGAADWFSAVGGWTIEGTDAGPPYQVGGDIACEDDFRHGIIAFLDRLKTACPWVTVKGRGPNGYPEFYGKTPDLVEAIRALILYNSDSDGQVAHDIQISMEQDPDGGTMLYSD